MLVYYFVPFVVNNRYLIFKVSSDHNSVTVQNWTHVYVNFFDQKNLWNHLLQLCRKVVKHPVYICIYVYEYWNILLLADNCAAYLQGISSLLNIKFCVLSKKLNKPDAFCEDGVWLNVKKDVSFLSYASVGNECAVHGITVQMNCLVIVWEPTPVVRRKERNMTFCQWWILPKPLLLTKLLHYSFTHAQHCQAWQTEH